MTSYRKSGPRESRTAVAVLYEDNHVIAVYKPAGVLVQGDRSGEPSLLDLVKAYVKERDSKPGNVFLGLLHRLDKPVSGVVLFAKTSKGASRLSEQFRTRTVTKLYRALVEGCPREPRGTLVAYLGEDGSQGVVVSPEPGIGLKRAELDYRVLVSAGPVASKEVFPTISLLEVDLGTGRKHQIRAQLGAIGCPIVGDKKYGARVTFAPGGIALVAHSLTFAQVVTGEALTVELPTELSPIEGWP